MNFLGKENRDEHTIAGRLLPFGEALHRSVMRASGQVVEEPTLSNQLPQWCHNMCDELTKSVFASLVKAAPREKEFSARNYGRIVGILLRGAVFFVKEAPAKLKQDGLLDLPKEQESKLEKFAGLPLLFSAAGQFFKKPVATKEQLIQAGEEHIRQRAEVLMKGGQLILQHLLHQPVQEQHEFLRGIPEGFASMLDYLGDFAGRRNRFDTFLVLAMHWPEVVEMQKAQPPKTRRDLLEWLEKQENRQIVTDEKQFFELCGDIGLLLAPPGNPQKTRRR